MGFWAQPTSQNPNYKYVIIVFFFSHFLRNPNTHTNTVLRLLSRVWLTGAGIRRAPVILRPPRSGKQHPPTPPSCSLSRLSAPTNLLAPIYQPDTPDSLVLSLR
ncbi:hypothetical protein Hdeb2414_s0001g00013881 [Helianthus debilis subsp. tardiflorus]